jgi:hypothetical protein
MRRSLVLLLPFLVVACASTAPPVDMEEERRVVGTEEGVRLDGFIRGDILGATNAIPFTWDITNERPNPIAVADMIPVADYDRESRIVTVNLGSEVPGHQLLPRLITIAPGEKKTFSGTIRVQILPELAGDPRVRAAPRTLQLKLNFLGDIAPFGQLVGITEKAVADRQLADRLFPLWLERNEVVLTGTVPMRWREGVEGEMSAARKRPRS